MVQSGGNECGRPLATHWKEYKSVYKKQDKLKINCLKIILFKIYYVTVYFEIKQKFYMAWMGPIMMQ